MINSRRKKVLSSGSNSSGCPNFEYYTYLLRGQNRVLNTGLQPTWPKSWEKPQLSIEGRHFGGSAWPEKGGDSLPFIGADFQDFKRVRAASPEVVEIGNSQKSFNYLCRLYHIIGNK
jgi:hypothetical protein